MRTLLRWITNYLPCRIINDGERPYLERYYLFTLLGWTFYLHQFVGSDPDRGLHDHPWPRAFSIILSGWYWEETRAGTRRVRWFNTLTGDTFHRVVLPYSQYADNDQYVRGLLSRARKIYPDFGDLDVLPCWTLFFHRAKKVKPWGFLKTVPDADGVAIFEPYTYSREGNIAEWWKTAPNGRTMRAMGRAA